jgi:hypothetical protein
MTTFPRSPRTLRAGLVLVNPGTHVRVIAPQYNLETLSHTLQVQVVGTAGTDERSRALRHSRWFGNAAIDVVPFEGCD